MADPHCNAVLIWHHYTTQLYHPVAHQLSILLVRQGNERPISGGGLIVGCGYWVIRLKPR
jgi:hypothetical protein